MRPIFCLIMALMVAISAFSSSAQSPQKWVTSWTGSVQGPYPIGNPSAQPDLRLAFPSPETGARDQSFRLTVRPDLWGRQVRLRFSNALGTRPITFEGIHVALQRTAAALVPGTRQTVSFAGAGATTVAPGSSVWSAPVPLPFVHDPATAELLGRKLAVSFHVVGESGPMTWHAKALTTSYLTAPAAGARGAAEDENAFPFSTASWYFLDAIDMMAPADARAIVAFGDSITDGTASTMKGDDRWPDVLARRLHAVYGNKIAVVNAGIGGNPVVGPAEYSPRKPYPGGPSAKARLDRDVLSLSGIAAVVWLEGINDFSKNGNAPVEAVEAGMKDVVGRIRAKFAGIRIIGATLTSALGSTNPNHGSPDQDAKRKALNEFIRKGGLFDGIADFDAATLDPQTGGMRAEFVPESTSGGSGDKIHPNRVGYLAMGSAIDLNLLATIPVARK